MLTETKNRKNFKSENVEKEKKVWRYGGRAASLQIEFFSPFRPLLSFHHDCPGKSIGFVMFIVVLGSFDEIVSIYS